MARSGRRPPRSSSLTRARRITGSSRSIRSSCGAMSRGRRLRGYPGRTLLGRGAVLAFGSDAPVEPIDPLLGIHAALTRRRPKDADAWFPEQRLTLDEALHAYTAAAAFST